MANTTQIITTAFSYLSSKQAYLTPANVQAICLEFNITPATLAQQLVAKAATFAVAPVSHFNVGAVALASHHEGDAIYIGANTEFNHQALSLVVHAEQSAIHNAWLNGALEITALFINAAPCGYCRQFINEITEEKQPTIHFNQQNRSIKTLLPDAFGPVDLGNHESLFATANKLDEMSDLEQHAIFSYAPYSGNYSACEITLQSGERYIGRYIENSAYSPSLSPLQAALNQVQLHQGELDFNKIETIALVETKENHNQKGVVDAIISGYPQIEFIHSYIKQRA